MRRLSLKTTPTRRRTLSTVNHNEHFPIWWVFILTTMAPLDSLYIPNSFVCTISHDIMSEPVITPCGHLFEKKQIEEWLGRNRKCPVCSVIDLDCRIVLWFSFLIWHSIRSLYQKPVSVTQIIKCYSLKDDIENFLSLHPSLKKAEKITLLQVLAVVRPILIND